MTSCLPELVLAIVCLALLTTCCACLWFQWWRERRNARRDKQTDSDISAFLDYGYKRGWTTRSWRDQYPERSEL